MNTIFIKNAGVRRAAPALLFAILVLSVFFMAGCGKIAAPKKTATPQKISNNNSLTQQNIMETSRVTLQTTDGVIIVGDFNAPNGAAASATGGGQKAALLLHMMPAVRASWAPLSQALNNAGIATLAIDLRGHGESTEQQKLGGGSQKLDYKKFTDAHHQASRLDVDAAMNFLKSKGFTEDKIVFAGASIGANLSLDALHRYKDCARAVLLSPGLDYKGVKTEQSTRQLEPNQKVFIAAAKGDSYSAESSEALQKLRPDNTKLQIFDGSEHGTNLFDLKPELVEEITNFLKN